MKDVGARVAIVGNPNTGKSTLFNALTGLRQRVANYPGVTVERKVGRWRAGDRELEVVDLPGAYSLAAASPDERVVLDVLSGRIEGERVPDVVVCVLDATNLSRHLFLASQVAEMGMPLVLALNQWDIAQKLGLEVDVSLLQERLGVRVVPTVASRREGVDALERAVLLTLAEGNRMNRLVWPSSVVEATVALREGLGQLSGKALSEVEARRVLFDAVSSVGERFGAQETAGREVVRAARLLLSRDGLNPLSAEAVLLYRHIGVLLDGVVRQPPEPRRLVSESVDALLTHRVWGLVFFLAMMTFVFQAVYAWSGPLMDAIEAGTEALQGLVGDGLESMPVVQSLVVDGVIAGVGGVLVFLPQIAVLFLFVGLLEGTGYMARAAYMMDRVFGWCGLSGKSFVPLLSSYACAIPGVMSARTIEDVGARLTTVLVAPLMSCSARLPVYTLLIGAFVEPLYGATVAGLVLLAMHFVGLLVAVPVAWVLNRVCFRTQRQPFVLELPAYRVPVLRDLLWRVGEASREFAVRAGSIILMLSVLLWGLLYFPREAAVAETVVAQVLAEEGVGDEEALSGEARAVLERRVEAAHVEASYLGRFGKALQPLFAPAGFDWKITVGVLSSFPAREVVISTLGILYRLGGDTDAGSLREVLAAEVWQEGPRAGRPVYTLPVVGAVLVFFALCLQCMPTVVVIARESAWRWGIFAFVYMTLLAWLGAVLTYQVGTWWSGGGL